MAESEQLSGRMLGEYRIERLLGRSQWGTAYLATWPEKNLAVMVTAFTFPAELARQERARLMREETALVDLRHPHILPIYAFGELADGFYLVSAFVREASLAQLLKRQERLTPERVLRVLKQLAEGLDYVHSRGIVHGMLSLTNVMVHNELEVAIAGFGLHRLLELRAVAQGAQPLAIFAGSPEYIAPERVLGQACDARVDIYALGVILYALLTGIQPFRAATPLEVVLRRLQQPVPSVHTACAEVPEAFDLVIARALEREPARRFQSAGEVATAFERVLKTWNTTRRADFLSASSIGRPVIGPQLTLPPTVNWFDEQFTPTGNWQLIPPGTANLHALSAISVGQPSPASTGSFNVPGGGDAAETESPGIVYAPADEIGSGAAETGTLAAIPPSPSTIADQANEHAASLPGIDPFTWWSSQANGGKPPAPPGQRAGQGPAGRRKVDRGRRKLVTLAAVGVAVAGAASIGGLAFTNLTRSLKKPAQVASAPTRVPTSVPTATPTSKPTATATSKPTATPTRAPTQPPPPGHTGTVIGSTGMAANSAKRFTNPADGNDSLLIRLPGGKFVACERACTHAGVPIDYDSGSHMLVCPAHGAIFDPANGFAPVSGPNNGPQPGVTVRVNGDGTITTG